MKKAIRIFFGTLFILIVMTIMGCMAYLPTWIINPVQTWSQTLCWFLFLTVYLVEIIMFILMLATYAKSTNDHKISN